MSFTVNAALSARRNGKTERTIAEIREVVTSGAHVHVATSRGVRCVNGPDGCWQERSTLAEVERELRGSA